LDFVRGVAFSPDGKWLVSTHYRGTVAIWDPATGKEVRRLETGQDSVQGVVISPDSQWFAVGTETGLRVWKLATGEPVAEHGPAHRGRLTGIAFARPTEVVTSGHDGTVRFWDALTGRQRLQVTHSSWVTCAVSPDGKRLATTAHDDTVRLWDAASGKEVFRLAGHGKFGGLYRVNFAPDGERLLSWGDDFSLRVWKTANGKALLEHAIRPSGIPIPDDVDELDNPDRRELEIRQLKLGLVRGTFSPDGKWLVLHVGSNFHIFDIATGKEARKLIGGRESVLALAISPDGRLLLNGSLSAVTVRDLATGKVLKEILLGDDRANAVAFSADGRRFAFGTRRPPGKIEIWEVASLSRAHTIEGLDGTADYLAFSPDGRLLAAAMDDTSGLVWDLARTAAARTAPSKESPP
jgi:WD40 repeat protein